MRRRRKHSLDLMPLLDVFMVVLFVFATIQERELEGSTKEADELRAEVEALREQQADRSELERARAAEAQAREQAAALQNELAVLREKTERAVARANVSGAEVLRRQEVFDKLVDHFSVFEIEITGEVAGADYTNRCCFRSDPFDDAWRPCGRIPPQSDALANWLDGDEGAGLVAALRRTKGGNALTIVRQSTEASNRLSGSVEELLRQRFPEHEIYDLGVSVSADACPR